MCGGRDKNFSIEAGKEEGIGSGKEKACNKSVESRDGGRVGLDVVWWVRFDVVWRVRSRVVSSLPVVGWKERAGG